AANWSMPRLILELLMIQCQKKQGDLRSDIHISHEVRKLV
ncbi:MAG: hypothetical protein ACJAUZ_002829, partial [Flavobacteriaceae bacterium]